MQLADDKNEKDISTAINQLSYPYSGNNIKLHFYMNWKLMLYMYQKIKNIILLSNLRNYKLFLILVRFARIFMQIILIIVSI